MKILRCSTKLSEEWVRWLKLESTDTGVGALLVSEDSEVTFFSPAATPGVLEEPEVFSTIGSVSDDENTVIKAGSAEVLHDSTEVELEAEASGIDGNGDWSLSNGGFKGVSALGGNISEGFDLGDSSSGVASSVSSGISVSGLGLDFNSFSVFESVIHESSLATSVTEGSRAVNKLLLRE